MPQVGTPSLDIQLLAVAIETSLLETIPEYNLYRVFSRLIGRKFEGIVASPFLWIKIVLFSIQVIGIPNRCTAVNIASKNAPLLSISLR